ncbi:alpha/beta hydrolase family esterase [Patescibacteria group bacterium]
MVHFPKNYNGNEKLPLVFVLHGAGGNAEIMTEITKVNDLSDQENFIVVYPNGTGLFDNYMLSWNAGKCCNFFEPFEVDDVDFIRTLIDKIQEDYNVDSRKIYISGLSNGAMMTHRLGCELADKVSAIAPVAGSMMIGVCNPSDSLSVISFHGKEDTVVPFEGGFSDRWVVKLFDIDFNSVPESISFWVKHNECFNIPEKHTIDNVTKEVYTGGIDNTEVAFYTFSDYGHVWPGAGRGIFFIEDLPKDVIATEIIWDFFKTHIKN